MKTCNLKRLKLDHSVCLSTLSYFHAAEFLVNKYVDTQRRSSFEDSRHIVVSHNDHVSDVLVNCIHVKLIMKCSSTVHGKILEWEKIDEFGES